MNAVLHPMHEVAPKVLLVTRRCTARSLPWADVASAGAEALALWHDERHGFVFADFGQLEDGMTGPRLTRQLCAASPSVQVFLLSDSVQPPQVAWARTCGAIDVIPRNAKAIWACLPSDVPAPEFDFRHSDFASLQQGPQDVAQEVTARLLRHGRIGPASSVIVEDAIESLVRSRGGLQPTAWDVALVVARQIDAADDRAAFLKSFKE
nr:hypothetical protein [uncultured Caldimonas sp.]